MERTEKISIGHYAFALDEKAYGTIKEYIATLERHYLRQADGAEIMDSVEARMAELLYERCGSNGVATEADIRAIIDILGYPETDDAGTSEPKADDGAYQPVPEGNADYNKEETRYDAGNGKTRRRLYRDPLNKKLGGVCGGIGQWMGSDPIWFRLLFAFTTIGLMISTEYLGNDPWFFIPVLLYIVLWFCIPKADTVKRRWEMRGESGSVDDINRYRYEREHGRIDNYPAQKQGRGCLAVGFGILILLIGLSGLATKLVVFGGVIFATNMTLGMFDWLPGMDLLTSLLSITPFTRMFFNPFIQILWALVFIIPSLLLIYGGIILIFDITTPKWRPGLCLLALWALLLIGMVPASYFSGRRAIKKIEKMAPDELPLSISGNIFKDFLQLKEWLDEHNFDSDDWPELQEWLEEHNFDDENVQELQMWLEEHNFTDDDDWYLDDSGMIHKPDSIHSVRYDIKVNGGDINIQKTTTTNPIGSEDESVVK